MKALPYAACALLGAFLDFLVYGVGEIIWPVVYLPIFLAGASILYTQLVRSRWEKQRRWAIGAFFAGIAVSRALFVNHHYEATYPMSAAIDTSVTLSTPGSPRSLLVSSDKVKASLEGQANGASVAVVVAVTTDYGCISNFQVSTVNGIDVLTDPAASWTWRTSPATGGFGAGKEDQELPWCRFRWYRKT